MKKKRAVFLSEICIKAPGLSSRGERENCAINYENFAENYRHAQLELDKKSPHYPHRRDLKVMRTDVVAATMCAGELIEAAGVDTASLEETPLFIANGICLDQLLNEVQEMTEVYLPRKEGEPLIDRQIRVDEYSHPLFALRALTNATESYVAQYHKILGDNTTFGNTSHGFYDALATGVGHIVDGQSERAIIGAANGAGIFSQLTFANFSEDDAGWTESTAAGFLVLESKESLERRGREPLLEIASLTQARKVPQFFTHRGDSPYATLIESKKSPVVCFSGGLSPADHQREQAVVEKEWSECHSWHRELGHLGTASIPVHLATAAQIIKSGSSHSVDVLNRDPYGREIMIQLKQFDPGEPQ